MSVKKFVDTTNEALLKNKLLRNISNQTITSRIITHEEYFSNKIHLLLFILYRDSVFAAIKQLIKNVIIDKLLTVFRQSKVHLSSLLSSCTNSFSLFG